MTKLRTYHDIDNEHCTGGYVTSHPSGVNCKKCILWRAKREEAEKKADVQLHNR